MKRVFDFTAALIGLVVASPIVAGAMIAIKLDSPGPALYNGLRVGRHGVLFKIHKLRSMRIGADAAGPAVTAGDDSRVTTVGRLLRRTKVDELPQLLNVLTGEMSLVGPRPEHPDYVKYYTVVQRRLLTVRPGMTGPSALAFINEEEDLRGSHVESTYLNEVLPKKLALELHYVEHATFGSDLAILFKTVAMVLRRPFVSS